MKSATSAIALVAAFLPIAFASPVNMERDVEYQIVTNVEVVTAWATEYYTPGATPVTTFVAAVAETTTVATSPKGKGRNRTKWTYKETTTQESVESSAAPVATSSSTTAPVVVVVTSTPEVAAWTSPVVIPITTTTSTPVSVAPKTTSTAATVASTPSAYTGDDSYSDANLQLAIINSTNTYRTMFQAASVAWNQSLVSMAAVSASACDFEHTNAGQNLAAGYSGPQGAVGGWGDEYKTFDFSNPDFSESCGHFTQLVWQDTTTVGCAAKKCPTDGSTSAQGWYLICNYFPVGNMLGEFPANVKSKAS